MYGRYWVVEGERKNCCSSAIKRPESGENEECDGAVVVFVERVKDAQKQVIIWVRVSSAFAATSGEEATAFGGDMGGNFVEGEFGMDQE